MNPLDYVIPKFGIKKPAQPVQPQVPEFDPDRPGPKDVYMTWEALNRPTQKFLNPKMTRTFAIIGVVVALFLFILQEYFLIMLVVSMIFVSQTLAKTPPVVAHYEISSYGVGIDDEIYYWHNMRRFFFFDDGDHQSAAIDMLNGFPSRLFLTLRPGDEAKVKEILGSRLQFLAAQPETLLDKAYNSVTNKINM